GPSTVSPGRGKCGTCTVRSTLIEPKTTIIGLPPDPPAPGQTVASQRPPAAARALRPPPRPRRRRAGRKGSRGQPGRGTPATRCPTGPAARPSTARTGSPKGGGSDRSD